MSDILAVKFPLTSREVKMLWLDLSKKDWTHKLWTHEWAYPELRNMHTFETMKTMSMLDMTNEQVARHSGISVRSYYAYKSEYWIYSEALCTLIDLRKDKVEVTAKTAMLWLLAKWDRNVVMEVVRSKDKRYRPNEQQQQESFSQFLWLMRGMSLEAKNFITTRPWLTKNIPNESSTKQEELSSDAEEIF